MAQSNMSDVTIHKNMLLGRVGIEENCRMRQKYSICLLEEVVVLGYFASKARVCRIIFCESVPFLHLAARLRVPAVNIWLCNELLTISQYAYNINV